MLKGRCNVMSSHSKIIIPCFSENQWISSLNCGKYVEKTEDLTIPITYYHVKLEK
jgi:hypothetical protein